MAESCVALLRAINVGGHNPLPMKALIGLFEAAGASNVRTYVASGNVIFGAGRARVPGLVKVVEKRIHEEYGYRPAITWRSGAEWLEVAGRHPFSAAGRDAARLHVAFLEARPGASVARAFYGDRYPPDKALLRGREVFLWLPKGVAGSKWSTTALEKALETVATVRNWRTVQEVAARL